MKCLFLTTEFLPGPGGIGTHSYSIINRLKNNNDWVFKIFLTEKLNSTDQDFKSFKKEYHSSIYLMKSANSVIKLIRNIFVIVFQSIIFRPNIIISSGRHATWYGAVLKFIFKKKLVTFCHGTEFGTKKEQEIKINNLAYSYSDLLIAVSNYTLKFIKDNTKIKALNTAVIHNGGDHKLFYLQPQETIDNFKQNKNISDKIILLTLGNISSRKGQHVIVNALPELVSKHKNILYVCIGSNDNQKPIIKLANELKVSKNLLITGKIAASELVFWLNSANIFLMTSVHTQEGDFEGFGISVIEAALCGTPAIVTKGNSGVIESIEENITGLSIPESDHNELARKVDDLLSDENKLQNLGKNASERALNKYTCDLQSERVFYEISKLFN